jgi:formylglycine-generating enzyme required for sulfatase activity
MSQKILGVLGAMLVLVFFLGCTNPENSDQTVNLLAISGVVAPEKGVAPVTTAIDTAQYSGTIVWSPSASTFAASTVYTATIVLTTKTGWTLNGVAVNSFTVAGSTATNAASSGTVTAVFPAIAVSDYVSPNIGTLKGIPAGSFQRDATATNISIISAPYRMSQHEITRAQFVAMLVTDPSDTRYSSGTSAPVQMVNWYHAIAFCNKLSLAEGLTPVYSLSEYGVSYVINHSYSSIPTSVNDTWDAATADWSANGYRLPTEMEWMWAAMGADTANPGATNTTGYSKAFAGSTGSNAIGDYAVYGSRDEPQNAGQTTTDRSNPVGSRTANELGLYDMTGNVWEWNWDWYADSGTWPNYAITGTVNDYRGAASGTRRVLRGGDFSADASGCTVAFRLHTFPDQRIHFVGFRVVRP